MPAAVGTRATTLLAAALVAVSTLATGRIGTDLNEEEQGTLLLDEARSISPACLMATLDNGVLSPVQAVSYHSHGPAALVHPHPRTGPSVGDIAEVTVSGTVCDTDIGATLAIG